MNRLTRCIRGVPVLLVLVGVLATLPAAAQTTMGVLRGRVTDSNGGVLAGVTVEATNDNSGIARTAVTGQDGFYNLSVPPDPYTVKATLTNLGTETRKAIVILGQAQTLDFTLSVKASEQVTAVAEAPLIDTRSNEVATNVSEQQLRTLPQDNRNFLNFAALAPGMHLSTDANNQNVSSGANEAINANVFIDGTSYKNDVLLGGVIGQDSSRGNPFPQNAVQEFRVITQNFKAEYEKSSSNVITAVTKSGGNTYQGTAFAEYQNKDLVAANPFAAESAEKPAYTRYQAGASIGGPIMKDAVHFFASWELNQQDYSNLVQVGSEIKDVPEPLKSQLLAQEGVFPSPFTENLLFGKLSFQASQGDVLDTSGFWRKESNVRDFGAQRSYEAATNVKQNIWNAQVQNQWLNSKYLSVTTAGYQSYQWNPVAVNPAEIGQDYEQVLRVGGQDTSQNFHQKVFSVREDFTLLDLHGFGDHTVKAGLIANFAKYDVQKEFTLDPVYSYKNEISFDFPYQARYGFGNPDLSSNNNQYGLYLQDDWTVNSRLPVNVGLRWDYETNGLDNKYVTPPDVYRDLRPFFAASYFTDGTQRPAYAKAFQPRLGFTYDVTGKGETIVFGGGGIYVDRDYYNALLDERFRLQYNVLTFQFSADGQPRCGNPNDPTTCVATIKWNDSYLTRQGLDGIISSGIGPKPQAFLINNGTGVPTTNQFSAGIRQRFGMWGVSAAWAGAWSRNGFTYIWGDVGGHCCTSPSPNYDGVLISDATKKSSYNALLMNIDKQYTPSSPWGMTIAYTYGKAIGNGGDLFTLDYTDVAASPYHRTQADQRHQVVLSGIVGLPWDSRFTTVLGLGTGTGFTQTDCSIYDPCRILLYQGTKPGTLPFLSWDMALQKDFYFSGQMHVGARIEVFNVTNHYNYGNYDGFIATLPNVNANYAHPQDLATPPRRLQFGIALGF
jgi:Carboxypeptidase regulatory-like domain/TonB dependent receptor